MSPQTHWLLISRPQAPKPCSQVCGLNYGVVRNQRAPAPLLWELGLRSGQR